MAQVSYGLSTFLRVEDLGAQRVVLQKGVLIHLLPYCLGSVSIHVSIRLIIEHATFSAISQLVRQAMVDIFRR